MNEYTIISLVIGIINLRFDSKHYVMFLWGYVSGFEYHASGVRESNIVFIN